MRQTRNFRQPFDAACEFVYLRAARVNGAPVEAGDPVDKSQFDARRLRQMYEATRLIAYAAGQRPAKPPPKPLAIGPAADARTPPKQHLPEKKRGIARIRRAA